MSCPFSLACFDVERGGGAEGERNPLSRVRRTNSRELPRRDPRRKKLSAASLRTFIVGLVRKGRDPNRPKPLYKVVPVRACMQVSAGRLSHNSQKQRKRTPLSTLLSTLLYQGVLPTVWVMD